MFHNSAPVLFTMTIGSDINSSGFTVKQQILLVFILNYFEQPQLCTCQMPECVFASCNNRFSKDALATT